MKGGNAVLAQRRGGRNQFSVFLVSSCLSGGSKTGLNHQGTKARRVGWFPLDHSLLSSFGSPGLERSGRDNNQRCAGWCRGKAERLGLRRTEAEQRRKYGSHAKTPRTQRGGCAAKCKMKCGSLTEARRHGGTEGRLRRPMMNERRKCGLARRRGGAEGRLRRLMLNDEC